MKLKLLGLTNARSCDVKDYKGVPRTTPARRWVTAEKMRSAVTRMYALQGARGRDIWHNSERTGNPSLSVRLSNYMQGLKRRKVGSNSTIY